jgi:hypothetical protein
VLGPGPPPWRKVHFYWILSIFTVFRAFNRAGKTVTKIGIYSKPPQKSEIYGAFNNLRPNLSVDVNFYPIPFNLSRPIPRWVSLFSLSQSMKNSIIRVFLWFALRLRSFGRFALSFWSVQTKSQSKKNTVGPQKGAFTGANTGAGNSSRPNFTSIALIDHYPIYQEQT